MYTILNLYRNKLDSEWFVGYQVCQSKSESNYFVCKDLVTTCDATCLNIK